MMFMQLSDRKKTTKMEEERASEQTHILAIFGMWKKMMEYWFLITSNGQEDKKMRLWFAFISNNHEVFFSDFYFVI
jgi:hypothetical protein